MEGEMESNDLLDQMRKRIAEIEKERDDVARAAEEVVAEKDAQLNRMLGVVRVYHRGEVGALDAMAMLLADFNGCRAPVVDELERQRHYNNAQVVSLMNEATTQLQLIEMMLDNAGIKYEGTHTGQVQSLLNRYHASESRVGDLQTLLEMLAEHLGASDEIRAALERDDYDTVKRHFDSVPEVRNA
jgi:hypothetical protein